MTAPTEDALLLDEMFPPALAVALRDRGHDVVGVAELPQLRSLSDAEVFDWAAAHRRRIVTENVKDYRPLLVRAQDSGGPCAELLLASSRTFRRSRSNPGPLLEAVHRWLVESARADSHVEDWLRPVR